MLESEAQMFQPNQRNLQETINYTLVNLQTPWGIFSLVQVAIAALAIVNTAVWLMQFCLNYKVNKLHKKLAETEGWKLKFVAAQRKIRQLAAERDKAKAKLAKLQPKKEPAAESAGKSGEATDPKNTEETDDEKQADKLTRQLIRIAKKLSTEKLKPDKGVSSEKGASDVDDIKPIKEMFRTLVSAGRNGGRQMSEKKKNEKSIVQEIGFFKLLIIGSLFSMLAKMVNQAWEKVRHRFEEDEDIEVSEKD